MESWGKELIIDGKVADRIRVTEPDRIRAFVDDLVTAIDMEKHGDLMLDHFATHDPNKAGWSFVQLIVTSNITAHFVDKDGTFYLNVFSCKDFDEEVVIETIHKWFGEFVYSKKIYEREARNF